MRKVLASLPYVLVTEGNSVREILLLKPNQAGRRPYHSEDLSCLLGQSYLVAPQRATRWKVNLSKIPHCSWLLLFQGTRFSHRLLYPGGSLYLWPQLGLMTNPEDLLRGRWPLDSNSQAGLLKSVVNFNHRPWKTGLCCFSFLLPIRFSTHLHLVRLWPSGCLNSWLGFAVTVELYCLFLNCLSRYCSSRPCKFWMLKNWLQSFI